MFEKDHIYSSAQKKTFLRTSALIPSPMMWNLLILRVFTKYQDIKNSAFQAQSIQADMHSTFRKGCPSALQPV